ncbi:MAG: flagellar motor switch protein FliN [bacterium]
MDEQSKEKAKELQEEETGSEEEAPPVTVVSEEETSMDSDDSDPEGTAQQPTDFYDKKLEMFKDVSFQLTVELGRKEIPFGEVLNLGKGSVIGLNKLAEEPVDIYVNQSKIAQGEVVVVDDYFGVRILRLLNPSEG